MKHVVKHKLDHATAKKAALAAWKSYSERFAQYHPSADWTTESHANIGFKVKGVSLKGALSLEPGGIGMELNVPFLFRPFQRKAISVIEREIQKWVDKAEAGEL
ncbi:MAG: hypothetical protein GXP55_20960 [Deltaproteobacteria bacterium]|nr:hypothetical protein [Deltaproteobacteria bacterium]